MTILWVGEMSTFSEQLRSQAETAGHRWLTSPNPRQMEAVLEADLIDCVCGSPSTWTGADLLATAQRINRKLPVIISNPRGTTSEAIRLMNAGAFYCTVEGISPERFLELISTATETSAEPADRPRSGVAWENILVGESRSMQAVRDIIRMVGDRRTTILITGETGTGKELAARSIHGASSRSRREMVSVNCTALPEHLLEAELFGHTRGAFTGAVNSRVGRFEQANQSTIFLDEIGDMPLDIQAKLLRVLQEREVQRLGSTETTRLDVRVVAASNINLQQAVQARKFREDLLYRLRVVELRMPSLRERLTDLPVLVDHFTEKICAREGISMKRFDRSALDYMAEYSWPGNVRQLEHVVESSLVLSGDRRTLTPGDVSLPEEEPVGVSNTVELPDSGVDLERFVASVELDLLSQALRRANGNKARAAGMLGIPRTTLISKVKSLQLAS